MSRPLHNSNAHQTDAETLVASRDPNPPYTSLRAEGVAIQ
jgi:hypothetical protein